MTEDEKKKAFSMVDGLEKEVSALVRGLGDSREFSIAITKLEEGAMWLRRAIERA